MKGDLHLAIQALRRTMEAQPPHSTKRARLRELIEELEGMVGTHA